MGLNTVLLNNYNETAVYWGSPANDGYGGFVYAEPVEITCRWEDIHQVVTDAKGNEITSRALVFVDRDVDEEGYLFKGTLEDLYDLADSSSGAVDDPREFEEAFIIKRFQKIPDLKGLVFLRKAYLTPSLSFGGF